MFGAKIIMGDCTCEFFAPFFFLNGDPLLDEVLSFGADFKVESLIEDADVLEQSLNSEDFLTSLKVKMTKGHQPASVIDCSLVVFDGSKFVEQFLHELIGAFLRYIVDKHFLPDFVLGTHFNL